MLIARTSQDVILYELREKSPQNAMFCGPRLFY